MSYKPIQCGIYDYIEIACLRHYTLEIKSEDGESITATAINTRVIDRQEFLVFDVNGDEHQMRLDKIKSITALDTNAEFKTIQIN